MLRTTISYSFNKGELQSVKNKMLNWITPFSIFSYLDNNEYKNKPTRFELLAAAGCIARFDSLPDKNEDWIFGHLTYDFKNTLEPRLSSRHDDKIGFATSFFYQPEIVAYVPHDSTTLYLSVAGKERADTILEQILHAEMEVVDKGTILPSEWQYRFTKEEYLHTIERLRHHIEEGDFYEINFCTDAYTEQGNIDATYTFSRFNAVNPSPFAALYRNHSSWLLCSSPERFLYRDEDSIISQPIKGTKKRGEDETTDIYLKQALLHDEKERAENIMIVDLVRNDLARSCLPGTISVPELLGTYSFPQVHQLISTVTGKVRTETGNKEIIHNAFPMGSMTGVPKVMVMEITDRYERSRRGIYAGTVGYITPEGNFDFNVVIRSLMYNEETGYLSYHTGGAITYDSDPVAEWEETRLKAQAMEQIFK